MGTFSNYNHITVYKFIVVEPCLCVHHSLYIFSLWLSQFRDLMLMPCHRYYSLIFEAISSTKDSRGADFNTIARFIEVRYKDISFLWSINANHLILLCIWLINQLNNEVYKEKLNEKQLIWCKVERFWEDTCTVFPQSYYNKWQNGALFLSKSIVTRFSIWVDMERWPHHILPN